MPQIVEVKSHAKIIGSKESRQGIYISIMSNYITSLLIYLQIHCEMTRNTPTACSFKKV